jgi:Cof subfamily protein (haloacid dehalogenase superfamily)
MSRQPRIRLLACDMDGTLFRQDLKISDAVQRALLRAQEQGVNVVLATGRMPAAARPFVELLKLAGPQIFANGALVQTTSGEVLFHRPIETPVARQVVEQSRAWQLHLNAYVGDDVYVESMDAEADFTRKLNRLEPILVPDLAAYVERPPTKMVIVQLPVAEAGLIRRFRERFGSTLLVSSSVPQYCELVDARVDKGRALRALTERLGLDEGEVAAIGDGDNDATLLEAAGLPIAMGNATPRLKTLAAHVVGSVEEDGVAQAIESFVLAR